MPFEEQLTELETRRLRALAMGGPEKLARRQTRGLLNARSRIDALFDPGSFLGSGMFAASVRPEDRAVTPADGKVAGFGRVDGREVAIVSNDFTVKGASSAAVNIKKLRHMKHVAKQRGIPIVLIDPRDTRDYLKRMLEVHRMRLGDGVGRHPTCGWPTSY